MADYYDTYGTNNSYGANDSFGGNDNYGANNGFQSNDTYGANDGYMSTGNSQASSGYDAADGLYSTNSQGQSSDDMLLEQIDAFREKAEQLQSIINERQSKANKLENLDNSKLIRQIDEMNRSINASLDNIQRKLDEQANNPSTGEGSEISEESITQITTSVNSIKGELNTMKEELSEKVHTENVKVYRNINDLLTEMKENDADSNNGKEVLKKVRGAKAVAGWALFFGILDFVGIAGVAALMLRMIGII